MNNRWVASFTLVTVTLVSLLGTSFRLRASWSGLQGYVEPEYATRFTDDGPIDERNVMAEGQFLLESRWYGESGASMSLKVLGRSGTNPDPDHDDDETDVDLREGSIFVPVTSNIELTVGRQILSWGPAQFEFINDHFSKDFTSFFIGRDLEFLKAPNDAAKFSWFTGLANLDLVVTPNFDPDVVPTGDVIPVFNPASQRLVSQRNAPPVREPEDSLDQGELHARVHKMYGRWEVALYGYRGFTGTPRGWNGQRSFFPELSSMGFSVRGPYKGAVVWVEGSYDDVRNDLAGDTTRLPPDRTHLMVGARYRFTPTLRTMLQATWDHQLDAETFRRLLPAGHPDRHENRFRLQGHVENTYLEDRLTLGVRGFWGVTEEDWHARLTANYEWSDAVSLHAGTLLYGADRPFTRFGALKDHDIVYTRLRYSF